LNENAKEIFNNHKTEELSEEIKQRIGAIVKKHQPDVT